MAKGKHKQLNKDGKYRMWNACLWPDDVTHNEAIAYIIQNFNCVGIEHNEDVYIDGDDDDTNIYDTKPEAFKKVKPHYHFIIKFPNARYRSGIADELGIDKHYFEPTEYYSKAAEYLLHINHPEKYQYDFECLVGSLRSDVIAMIERLPLDEMYQQIIHFIDMSPRLSVQALQKYCLSQCYFSCMKACYRMLIDYLIAHNEPFTNKDKEKGGE